MAYEINIPRLLDMLSLCRRHDTAGEAMFVSQFITPFNPMVFTNDAGDTAAYVVEVRNEHGVYPPILFSAHVDTVHPADAPMYQKIVCDMEGGFVYKEQGDKLPLGADNAAGCAVLMHMIENNVPGVYVFHRGEEVGGIGSTVLATQHEDWLSQFHWAIAFDRRGNDSVITEMMVGDTASDEFAEELSSLLNDGTRFNYKPDPTGSFTDTANYAHIIPECTNVSVGYDDEHSGNESLDLWHLNDLAVKLVEVFRDGPILPEKRDPTQMSSGNRWWSTEFDIGWGGTQGDLLNGGDTAAKILTMGFKQVVDYVKENTARDVAEVIYELADRIAELEEAEQEAAQDRERYTRERDSFDLYN